MLEPSYALPCFFKKICPLFCISWIKEIKAALVDMENHLEWLDFCRFWMHIVYYGIEKVQSRMEWFFPPFLLGCFSYFFFCSFLSQCTLPSFSIVDIEIKKQIWRFCVLSSFSFPDLILIVLSGWLERNMDCWMNRLLPLTGKTKTSQEQLVMLALTPILELVSEDDITPST